MTALAKLATSPEGEVVEYAHRPATYVAPSRHEYRPGLVAGLFQKLRRLTGRESNVRTFIGRYRLWPVIESACDRVADEFERAGVRAELTLAGIEDGDPFVLVRIFAPTDEIDFLLDLEDEVTAEVRRRFGRAVTRKLSISVNPDPDFLPAFD